jgi:hypothetical protein
MNMLETLGALIAIGAFVFWCDVTDSWKTVFLRNKFASWLRRVSDRARAGLSGLDETSAPLTQPAAVLRPARETILDRTTDGV